MKVADRVGVESLRHDRDGRRTGDRAAELGQQRNPVGRMAAREAHQCVGQLKDLADHACRKEAMTVEDEDPDMARVGERGHLSSHDVR